MVAEWSKTMCAFVILGRIKLSVSDVIVSQKKVSMEKESNM